MQPSNAKQPAGHGFAVLIATLVSILAIAGLIRSTGGTPAGAMTLSDQAAYEMAIIAYNRCDPESNPFIMSPVQQSSCCTSACFAPCVTSGLPDCTQTCKAVCTGSLIYKGGGTP